jgi:hypothetical protein
MNNLSDYEIHQYYAPLDNPQAIPDVRSLGEMTYEDALAEMHRLADARFQELKDKQQSNILTWGTHSDICYFRQDRNGIERWELELVVSHAHPA